MSGVIPAVRHKQRLLKPLSGGYIPPQWLFLDTETTLKDVEGGQAHFFNIGWTCLWIRSFEGKRDHYDWQFFSSEKAFNEYLQFIAVHLKDVIIVGHNIYFDLQACGFFDYFTRWGWSLNFYYDQGLTYILKCTKGKAKITLCSTTNWFNQSLKKLGHTLGLEKLDVDFDTVTPAKLKTYCRRDVEIIVKAMGLYLDFITDHELGKFSLTKASQAFTAFRTRFMKHRILIHSHPEVLEMERSAYVGGRTEAFFIGHCGGGPFVTLDVNSMYPYVMKAFSYPFKLIELYSVMPLSRLKNILKTYAVIALVEVKTDDPAYAVKCKGKTIFPIGQFKCFLCTQGLKYALENGHIVRIHRAAVYQKADLFSGYVDYFHELRVDYKAKGNDIMALLCKYMHNSLYGKFGQLKINTLIEIDDTGRGYFREDIPNLVTGRLVVVTHLMNRKITKYPEGEGEFSNVAIAAHITENARFTLWEMIKKAGPQNVLYCDTDSMKLRKKDAKNITSLIDPDRLGALKVEDTVKKLVIEGAKNYRSESIRKIKGIPRNAKEISPGVFSYTSFVRQVSHLRGGMVKGALIRTITRRLTAVYDKGRVTASGKVEPFHWQHFPPPL